MTDGIIQNVLKNYKDIINEDALFILQIQLIEKIKQELTHFVI